MKVNLLWYTPKPEFQCALAMRRCYSALPMETLEAELTAKGEDYIKYLMNRVREDKSFDIWEHAVFMFSLEGVSRVTTHQLVRHRMCSFDQESQRFAPSPLEFVIPESIVKANYEKLFRDHMDRSWRLYIGMINDAKIPKQDARYVLPGAAKTSLVMTTNARNIMHLLYMRTAKGAQWEIKDLSNKIYDIVKSICPSIFETIVQC